MNLLTTTIAVSSLTLSLVGPITAADLPLIEGASIDVVYSDSITYHVIEVQGPGAYTVTLLETEAGVVGIDTGPGRLPGFGDALNTYINAIEKPFSLIVTHAHGDHHGNIGRLNPDAVYAESNAAEELGANEQFTSSYKDDVKGVSGSITLYGITLSFGQVANAEFGSGHNGYAYIESSRDLFPGDLLYIQQHNYIREFTPDSEPDEISNWISGLENMKSEFGNYDRVFVGHGGMSDDVSAIFDHNIEYLNTAHDLITGGSVTSNQAVVDILKAKFPDYGIGALNLSLPGSFGENDPGANWYSD